jgi:hypothetical protein
MGLVNTLINVYTAQGGSWSVTATVTAAVTASFAGISGALVLLYNWRLARIKKLREAEPRKRRLWMMMKLDNGDEQGPTICKYSHQALEVLDPYDWSTPLLF